MNIHIKFPTFNEEESDCSVRNAHFPRLGSTWRAMVCRMMSRSFSTPMDYVVSLTTVGHAFVIVHRLRTNARSANQLYLELTLKLAHKGRSFTALPDWLTVCCLLASWRARDIVSVACVCHFASIARHIRPIHIKVSAFMIMSRQIGAAGSF